MQDFGAFDYAYLVKVQRDVRATELLKSIHCPGRVIPDLVISINDVDALAIAFEQCTPDEAARWVALLLTADADELIDLDDLEDEDGEDAD